MSIATTNRVTLEEFLRLEAEAPENVTLELIDGEIVEKRMSTRSPKHSLCLSLISHRLLSWLESQDVLVGSVNTGEVRCRIQDSPERIVGIDIGVWLGQEFVTPPSDPPLYEVPPTLAVEVLSPSDTIEYVDEKLIQYLAAGVAQVWIVDPEIQTVTIHRPNDDPQVYSSRQTLTAEPELAGFSIAVSQLFRPASKVKRE